MAGDLAERRGLTLEHSHQWLAHVGLARPRWTLVDGDAGIVADARAELADGVRRIADEVRNSIDYYRTQEMALGAERAVLTGAGARDPGLRRSSSSTDLGMPVEPRRRRRGGSRRARRRRAGPSDRRRRPRGRGARRMRAVNLVPRGPSSRRAARRRGRASASTSCSAASASLLVALTAWVLVSNSINENQTKLVEVSDQAVAAEAQAARAQALHRLLDAAQDARGDRGGAGHEPVRLGQGDAPDRRASCRPTCG